MKLNANSFDQMAHYRPAPAARTDMMTAVDIAIDFFTAGGVISPDYPHHAKDRRHCYDNCSSGIAHLTLVGDRHQQIYEWRGAVNAMASIETDEEAFLTRSFRFGDSVAGAATSILKLLGETRAVVGPNRDTTIAAAGRTGTILCRTNIGVVAVVVAALSENRKPHVVGGVAELIRMLEDVGKLKRSIPGESPEFLGYTQWDEVVDFAESEEGESLRSFVKIVRTYGEATLIRNLRLVARDEQESDLIVSTGHKAKGREWDTVTLSSDFEPRLTKDVPPKEVFNQEEARLLYVAATRARHLLVVPPRLAVKWNATPEQTSRIIEVSNPSVISTARPKSPKPIPQLPSFAKIVPPHSTELRKAKGMSNTATRQALANRQCDRRDYLT